MLLLYFQRDSASGLKVFRSQGAFKFPGYPGSSTFSSWCNLNSKKNFVWYNSIHWNCLLSDVTVPVFSRYGIPQKWRKIPKLEWNLVNPINTSHSRSDLYLFTHKNYSTCLSLLASWRTIISLLSDPWQEMYFSSIVEI